MDNRSLAEKLVKILTEKNLVIATAESCTGGLIAKTLTDVPGASNVFECGIVSYANTVKEKLLYVKKKTLKEYGAVSRQTAVEMAKGCCKRAGSDIAVAVTGIAGPSSDNTNKPVGLVYVAVCDSKNHYEVKECHFEQGGENVRENNRNKAAETALETALNYAEIYSRKK